MQTPFPDTIDVQIESMAQGGDAVARWEGYVVFVSGALPGETVRVAIRQRTPAFARGVMTEILGEPSPDRVEPRMVEGDHMPWQHIRYEAQTAFKQQIASEQAAKFTRRSDIPIDPIRPAPQPWNYRNIAVLRVAPDQATIGYYATGSHRIVDLPNDPLLMPVLNEALRTLRALLPFQHVRLQEVMLRASATTGRCIAQLEGTGRTAELIQQWQEACPTIDGVAMSVDTKTRELPMLVEKIADMTFLISARSFFQINTAQAQTMVDLVREGLQIKASDVILDAYSGLGTFALPLSRGARRVIAIEENVLAARDGRHSAKHNETQNVRFVQGAVERSLAELEELYTLAVLDPPRRGCHPAVIATLREQRPRRIAYVSCHPATMARDVSALCVDDLYTIERITPVDMFPQTPHIEQVVILARSEEVTENED